LHHLQNLLKRRIEVVNKLDIEIMKFLNTASGRLAYEKWGDGKRVHLLFHGFGMNMKSYAPYLSLRTEEDSFLVFDIFYHGNSSWRNVDQPLTKAIWRDIIEQLRKAEGFDSFHLVGYSMGGKFSLVTYELFPEKVESMVLMAPDGIKTGFWYNQTKFPNFLNRIIKPIIFFPERFFKWMERLAKLGLLQSSLLKFIRPQMLTRTMRARVYFTWIVFKPMKPDLGKIVKAARKLETPITLITGEYDKMVTSKNLAHFSSKIPHLQNVELACGHNDLIEETAGYMESSRLKTTEDTEDTEKKL
jgi:pimeloyl-ACP methyl ester carboxylesterase